MMFAHSRNLKACQRLMIAVLVSLFGITATRAEDSPAPLVFGIAPFMSPMALVKRMAPLRDYLSEALGVEVIIETSNDAEEFVKRTLAGRYHFVLTNPVFSLRAMDQGDFQLLASQHRLMAGYFVVMEDSPIREVHDLAGRLVGAPPKVGFLGQLIMPLLESMHFPRSNMPRVKYFHSHNDAVAALRLGETDASFIVSFMEPHLLARGIPIRTIYRSRAYPGLSVLAHKRMSRQHTDRLQESLISMHRNIQGKRVLQTMSMPAFRSIEKDELESVRPYLAKQIGG